MLAKLKDFWKIPKRSPPQSPPDFQEWLADAEDMARRIADAEVSITVADPSLDDVPLIGISAGFTTLTGYSAQEILGRNCRCLIEPVPGDLRNQDDRNKARKFSQDCQKAALKSNSSVLMAFPST